MKAAFKVYGLVVLFIIISGGMYGFLLPYMMSSRNTYMVMGGMLLAFASIVPLAHIVYVIVKEIQKQLKLKRRSKQ